MTDRLNGLHLQRRAGRRKSTPVSPISPSLSRKHGRSQDSALPVFSPIDTSSATTSNYSPTIDLIVPSPTFNLSTISPALEHINDDLLHQRQDFRVPERPYIGQLRTRDENVRPAASDATGNAKHIQQNYEKYSSDPAATHASPAQGGTPRSSETLGRPSSRETNDEISAQRAAAFWAQYDKTSEDSVIPKGTQNPKKSRFNLLNPMSLLARRRSSQNTNKLEDTSVNVNTLHVPAIPDNITPSIRGSIVHDFSAPRTRRLNSDYSPRPGPAPNPNYPRRPPDLVSQQTDSSAGTPSSLHSPMFREHFQEEQRSINPQNTAYLHGHNLQVPSSGSLPTFAKRLPLIPPEDDSHIHQPSCQSKGQAQIEELQPPEPEVSPPPPPPPAPTVVEPLSERTPSPASTLQSANIVPKHMTSTSSRFSYIGQQGSIAQEKFLEAKHKEHALKNPPPRHSVASVDIDDIDDYTDLDEEDGFDNADITIKNVDMPSSQVPQDHTSVIEEGYPLDDDDEDDDEFGTGSIVVRDINMSTSRANLGYHDNEALDPDAFPIDYVDQPVVQEQFTSQNTTQGKRQSLQAFHFTPQSHPFSPMSAQNTSQSTPRDVEGLAIGTAQSRLDHAYGGQPQARDGSDQSFEAIFYEGLGISTRNPNITTPQTSRPNQQFDDFDFDDGEFDDDVVESSGHFDEDALDDGDQIKDIPAENARKYEEAVQRSQARREIEALCEDVPSESFLGSESPESNFKEPPPTTQTGLTADNLAAYHDALAMAATKAAEDGKFNRSVSFSQVSDDETDSPFHNTGPEASTAGSRYSNNIISSAISDEDGFGFDDDLDDEAMIAAANAEALENDDDGFYGQEFGFFARARGKESAEYTNGGYFASRGSNGIKRSHSGKNNFQEPNLTPITERSEWSTRNSIASLPLHIGIPGTTQSLPSPGIAHLLERDSPIVDDEMSMSTLMKLRGRAFGGSSTSINSLADRHHAHTSPLAHSSGYHVAATDGFAGRMSSPAHHKNLDLSEFEDEDVDHGNEKFVLPHNTFHKKLMTPVRDTSHSSSEQVTSSPMSRKGNHSRNSSGAESVSYARDDDGRWVLERRRTGDDGELELIDREYLEGMRI
ncbi:hypothetical protein LTR05_003648 [Lithohypha guttulata]|uniref:Uncharacterized protein n=1 Tax=Lithohypha guttulata TaxID=1690604 RepID=A0AAN7T0H9_9EURO|nr:hypothetical protein LTR05_003648 [Lithohypha guttulata]